MFIQSALKIPFNPKQCPKCKYYYKKIHRCKAHVKDVSIRSPILGMFSGESTKDCEKFVQK